MSTTPHPLSLQDLAAFGAAPDPTAGGNNGKPLTLEQLNAYGNAHPDPHAMQVGGPGDLLGGVGAHVLRIPVGTYDILRKIPGVDKILPEPNAFVRGISTAPDTMMGHLGDMGAGIAEFAIPAARAAKATEAMGLVPRALAQAGVGGGVAAVDSGGDPAATAEGAVMGGLGPTLIEPAVAGLGKIAGKFVNRAATVLPEDALPALQSSADAAASAAKQTGIDAANEIRTANTKAPLEVQKNTSGFTDAAQQLQNRLSGSLANTQFGDIADVASAAKNGDKRAAALLLDAKSAHTPDQIQQASINLRNWKTGQVSSGLYGDVDKAIQKAGIADTQVPLTATESAIQKGIDEASTGRLPENSRITNLLNSIKGKTVGGTADEASPILDASGKPQPAATSTADSPDNSYSKLRQFDSELGNAIRDGKTGKDALIGDSEIRHLTMVRDALRSDMDSFIDKSGAQPVKDAYIKAQNYYRDVRAPYKELDLSRAATATDSDTLYDQMIKAQREGKAQRFYDALDDKGRTAVRGQMVQDAANQATDDLTGQIDPAKFHKFLGTMQDAHNVFFKGADAQELAGLRNVAKSTALQNEAARLMPGRVGQISGDRVAAANARSDSAKQALKDQQSVVSADVAGRNKYPIGKAALGLEGAASGLAALHMPGAAAAAAGLGGVAGIIKFLTSTDTGLRFLRANSILPGIAGKVAAAAPATVSNLARGAGIHTAAAATQGNQ